MHWRQSLSHGWPVLSAACESFWISVDCALVVRLSCLATQPGAAHQGLKAWIRNEICGGKLGTRGEAEPYVAVASWCAEGHDVSFRPRSPNHGASPPTATAPCPSPPPNGRPAKVGTTAAQHPNQGHGSHRR